MDAISALRAQLSMTYLHRSLLCILLIIIGGNILLYSWFADRIKENANDRIVQKAYIVSRLISESGSRALAANKPSIVRSTVEEALKDQHLVEVVIKGKSGEVLLKTSSNSIPEKLSVFETPILIAGKNAGTVTTRFHFDGTEAHVATDLSRSAAVQSILLAIIAMVAAATVWLKRRRKTASAPLLIHYPSAAAPITIDITMSEPATSDKGSAREDHIFTEVLAIGESLRKAMEILAKQPRPHHATTIHPFLAAQEAKIWERGAAAVAERSRPLIHAGSEIITILQQEFLKVAASGENASAAGVAARLRIAAACQNALYPDSMTEERASAATSLFLTLEQSLRQSALPDLLAADAANEVSGDIISSLDSILVKLEAVSSALLSGSELLYETATIVEDDEETTGGEECSGSDMAASMRRLAEAQGNSILILGEHVRQAGELSRALGKELCSSKTLSRSAGRILENAATAALQGKTIFDRLNAAAESHRIAAAEGAAVMADLAEELEKIPAPSLNSAEFAELLAVAAETLQLGMTIMGDMEQRPLTTDMTAELSQNILPDENLAATEELIKEAQLAASRLLLQISAGVDR